MVVVYDSVDVMSNDSRVSSNNTEVDNHLAVLDTSSEVKVRKLKRLVEKDGRFNVVQKPGWVWYNPTDPTNILEMKWFSFIFLTAIVYLATFAISGALFLIPQSMHRHHNKTTGTGVAECYEGVYDLTTGFLFSFETGQTIGYGTRFPNADCPDGIILLFIVIFWTTFITTVFAGVILAKFNSNQCNSENIRFSSQAVINQRNGSLFLVFRVADPFESGMDYGAEASVICVTFRDEGLVEGSPSVNFNLIQVTNMPVGFQSDGTNPLIPLIWPTTVSHKIDPSSPLYRLGPDQLSSVRLELIVTMSGVRTETGAAIESVTSYTSTEIVWGARFCQESVLKRTKEGNVISFAQEDVDKIYMDNTQKVSAEQLDIQRREIELESRSAN